jgi:serine phosphatase RsbU (regulator of sigma subunit)
VAARVGRVQARTRSATLAGTRHAKAAGAPGESPLVRTVTRIIGVVPLTVRIALGCLMALALALAASSRLSSARARRLERQRGELLEDVGLLQQALLPAPPPRIGPVLTSAAYRPASGPAAGGDFYDLFALADGRIAVIVGDVSGHGRGALSHTALLRFTLRAYLEAGLSPRNSLQRAAPVLERQLGGSLATVVLAVYHPRERTLTYSCAGHPPPLVIGHGAVTPVTACSAPPIGASLPTGTRQTTVSIPGGCVACFYTDGLVEARVGGELFGAARLSRSLAALAQDRGADDLLDRVAQEADRRPDDMAACLLRIDGEQRAPVVLVEEIELDRAELRRDRLERFLLATGMSVVEAEEVVRSAGASVARNGAVLLELHLRQGPPEIRIQPQNLSILEPSLRVSALT